MRSPYTVSWALNLPTIYGKSGITTQKTLAAKLPDFALVLL